MRSRIAIVIVLVALAACSKKRREVAAATRDECTQAMDRVVKLALEARKQKLAVAHDDQGIPTQVPEPARAIADRAARAKTDLVTRCVDQRWGTAVVRCFATANSIADCERGLSKLQLEAYRMASLALEAGSGSAGPAGAPGSAEPPRSP